MKKSSLKKKTVSRGMQTLPSYETTIGVPILKAEHISWTFDNSQGKVLDDLSCSINSGTFTTILGPNGSGKTTFLKTFLRMLPPEKNTIFLTGKDVLEFNQRDIARIIGAVPQNTATNYTYTVEEMIMMGRYPHINRFSAISSHDRKLVDQAMQKTETLHLRDHGIHEISGGELQRVIIGRALAQEPRILALDEPTNHLDPRHQIAILQLLKQLVKEGISVICVLHDLNSAMQYSDQIILLDKGKIACSGPPEEVLKPKYIKSVYHIESQLIDIGKERPYIILPEM